MSAVRVRFAPSPTGFLHVGGARTAIFNWLYVRRHAGVFILRIEDTDLARSSEPMVRAILEGMEWLGMSPDEGPFYQSEFRQRHVLDALRLLDRGRAYRCFCEPEAIKRERHDAERSGQPYVYPRRCVHLPDEESAGRAAAGKPFAIRFKVPIGRVVWDDLVHGITSFENETVEDFVLLRSDGTPTYMMSVVSDDITMRISHVIRGDDHTSNTPKQLLLYEALGTEPPIFAHLPLILGEDKKRLSKRHGAVSVLDYRDKGYLAEALFNFLALLGWSPPNDRQKMSRLELVESFDFSDVGKSGAVFDNKKFEWLNSQYLTTAAPEAIEPEVRRGLEAEGLWRAEFAGPRRGWFLRVVTLLQPRSKTLLDFVSDGRPFFDPKDDFRYEPEAEKRYLTEGEGLVEALTALKEQYVAVPSWSAPTLEATLRTLAASRVVPAGTLIHPIRLAVTGKAVSPGLFEVLELLGRERTLARLDRMVRHLSARSTS